MIFFNYIKNVLKLYEVKEPRAILNLLIVVVDFNTVKNSTIFITTIGYKNSGKRI